MWVCSFTALSFSISPSYTTNLNCVPLSARYNSCLGLNFYKAPWTSTPKYCHCKPETVKKWLTYSLKSLFKLETNASKYILLNLLLAVMFLSWFLSFLQILVLGTNFALSGKFPWCKMFYDQLNRRGLKGKVCNLLTSKLLQGRARNWWLRDNEANYVEWGAFIKVKIKIKTKTLIQN